MEITNVKMASRSRPLPIAITHIRHGDTRQMMWFTVGIISALQALAALFLWFNEGSGPGAEPWLVVAPVIVGLVYEIYRAGTNASWARATVDRDTARAMADFVHRADIGGYLEALPPVPSGFPSISNSQLQEWCDDADGVLQAQYTRELRRIAPNSAPALAS